MPFFFFKQKTAYDMRISDWSSDVCSSDLAFEVPQNEAVVEAGGDGPAAVRGHGDPLHETAVAAQLGPRRPGRRQRRSAERRVGQECVSTCRSRGSTYH